MIEHDTLLPKKKGGEELDYQEADVGVYLLGSDSGGGQGVCPAAQRGHFHLNGGPSEPGGVTLATVTAIVPAVSECEKQVRGTTPQLPKYRPPQKKPQTPAY